MWHPTLEGLFEKGCYKNKPVRTKAVSEMGRKENARRVEIKFAAFKKGQSRGLVDSLRKMQPVGRIAITGTLGYDLAYVRLIRTPTGRTIRFTTNRLIRFGEAYTNSQTRADTLLRRIRPGRCRQGQE